jgi:hypothetical protein
VERLVDRDAGAAEEDRRECQHHPAQRENLLLAQQRGHAAKDDRADDQALDQDAHHRHRVVRAKLRRRQQLGKVQAEDGAE